MNRRNFISSTGGVILASYTNRAISNHEVVYPSKACKSSLRQTQGPYLIPGVENRSDVREGSEGVLLKLELEVVDDLWCTPLPGYTVEIWHCDAHGYYSGVGNIVFNQNTLRPTGESIDMTDKTFLRGYQVTDDNGKVEFTTIYPGWYMPRLAHIHIRLVWHDIEWTSLDTQLYLPMEVEQEVYQTEPYAQRGPNPIDVERDLIIKGDQDALNELMVDLEKDGNGYVGRFQFAATAL